MTQHQKNISEFMRRAEQEPPFVSWTYLLGLGLALLLSSQATAQTTFQPNTDRRSPTDYEEFPMTRPNPQLCLDACLNNAPCRSWTFVKTPDGGADCRLGNQKHEPVHAKYRCQCISNLELSVARCMGSGGGRVRSPGVAQRPTGARCTDARNSTDCFYRAGVSRLGS